MARKEIVIQGVTVPVTLPYVAGHVLTEPEARSLNQTRCENIRNNMASEVKKILAMNGDEAASPEQLAEIGAKVAKYDAEYSFAMPGVARVPRDPLEAEARSLAKKILAEMLREAGIKAKDYENTEAKLDEIAEAEDVRKQAKENVAKKAKLSASVKERLGTL